ncbi:unnamed protein product [Eruca vesicaria subsp. sativa]|uniref:Uncharacterized protein n=1 Tax=Eruca vesicaria subsp. sativa TaxID=29727 RepID=A0ABC8IVC5_ERUVS|nr:unnamed protein product [Eruca vesicaria subsp. sativa]
MRAVRNLRFASAYTRKPEAIVAALNETNIRATISCSKLLNLELRVRSGGHDYKGFSDTYLVPFVILDMYNFNKIERTLPFYTFISLLIPFIDVLLLIFLPSTSQSSSPYSYHRCPSQGHLRQQFHQQTMAQHER